MSNREAYGILLIASIIVTTLAGFGVASLVALL
jgi:hypothetical protein